MHYRNRRIVAAFVGVSLLAASCAAPNPIFYGLDANSYGKPIGYRDPGTNTYWIPSCDPTLKYADMNELGRKIGAALFSAFGRANKVDDSILAEGLQDKFLSTGDTQSAHVALLDRNSNEIVFWHMSDFATLTEVSSAAQTYCKKFNKTAQYVGTARKCSDPMQSPIAVNGNRTVIFTYAISKFACVGSSDVRPRPPSRGNRVH